MTTRPWRGTLLVLVCAGFAACGTVPAPAGGARPVTTSAGVAAAHSDQGRAEFFAAAHGTQVELVHWPRAATGRVAGTFSIFPSADVPQQQTPFAAGPLTSGAAPVTLTDPSGSRLGTAQLSADGTVLTVELRGHPVLTLPAVTAGELDQLRHGMGVPRPS